MIHWNNIGQPISMLMPFNMPNSTFNVGWTVRGGKSE